MRRPSTQRRKAQRPRPPRPIAIIVITAVTCGCAVTVANGQVSVPGVKTPPVNVPDLQQNLPQVPSTPQLPSTPKVPQVSLPKVPQVSLPKTQVQVPSTNGVVPKVPSVRLPSIGATGGGGSAGGGNTSGAGAGTATAAGGSAAQGAAATASAARAATTGVHGQGPPLTPKQRSARHERRLQNAAHQLEGCLSALSGFDRQVIVLRGGLHGRSPLSRADTAQRLNASAGRVRSAERTGLAGLRKANTQSGCGLRTGAGRNEAARKLADGSAPALSPLAVVAPSPALVAKDALPTDRGKVKGAQASSHGEASKTPSRASLLPTSGGEGSDSSSAVWVAILAALAIGGAVLVLLLRRRTADPYGYYHQSESAYPYAWDAGDWDPAPEADQGDRQQEVEDSSAVAVEAPPAVAAEPEEEVPARRRRDRAAQAFGGVVASGAAVSLLLGRLVGRRRRR